MDYSGRKRGWDGRKKKTDEANEKRKMGKVKKSKRWGGQWSREGKKGKGWPGPTRVAISTCCHAHSNNASIFNASYFVQITYATRDGTETVQETPSNTKYRIAATIVRIVYIII